MKFARKGKGPTLTSTSSARPTEPGFLATKFESGMTAVEIEGYEISRKRSCRGLYFPAVDKEVNYYILPSILNNVFGMHYSPDIEERRYKKPA